MSLLQYRELQLLSRLLKNFCIDPMMQAIIGGTILLTSASLYIILTSTDQIPLPVLILFYFMAFDCFVLILFLFKRWSFPYTRSEEFIKTARQGLKKMSRWEEKYIASCSPLKVESGNDTFVDRSTSLLISRIVLDQLVTFLLL